MNEQQQKFEKWAKGDGLIRESHGIRSESSHVATAWQAWQAAIASQAPRQALSDIDALSLLEPFDLKQPANVKLAVVRAIEAASGPNAVITNEQIEKAARYLCDKKSEELGVNKDDAWNMFGSYEAQDLRAALAAAGVDVK